MIDEETLANLFAEHGGRIPVPATGIEALLARLPEVTRHTLARRLARPSGRTLAGAVAFALVATVVVALAWPNGSSSTGSKAADRGEAITARPPAPPSTLAGNSGGASAGSNRALSSAGVPAGGFALTPPHATDATTPAPNRGAVTAPTDTARVIRTAAVDLRIARHSFGTVVSRVTTVAAAEGGFIADANTNEAATTPSGTMTVRVPSARFNDTVGRLRALGTVESQTTRGTDVTGQYTDLTARRDAAIATREAYLAILSRATSIGDVLAIQDRVEGVQTQIDQLQGQINGLDNQTTYATITLSVSEPPPKPKPIVKPHKESGLAVAWNNARHGFTHRIESLISHSGSALVLLLSIALLAFLLRLLIPRARRLIV